MLIAGPGHVHMIIASQFASFEPRGVSLLYFADRLFQLPLGFVASAIGVVLLPRVSRALQRQDGAAVASAQSESLSFAALLILPSAVGLMVLAEPIITVLFQRAAFTAEDSAATAANLQVLALALPAFVVVKIILPSYLARERMVLPLVALGAALLVNIATVLALAPRLGLHAPVIGVAAGAWANALILMVAVRGRFELSGRALRRLASAGLAALAMGLAVAWLAGLAAPWLRPELTIAAKGGALAALCLAGGAIFLALALLLRAVDLSMLVPKSEPVAGRSDT
jgi:putative peptidoglycan lipid II flippase